LVAAVRDGLRWDVGESFACLMVKIIGDETSEIEPASILVPLHGHVVGQVVAVGLVQCFPVWDDWWIAVSSRP
jgi:hypothetical protein